jgi:zinc/manganese transport system substrate-binding protein
LAQGFDTLKNANGETDPHAWQNVLAATFYIKNIRDALVIADEANTNAYVTNANDADTQLMGLHQWILGHFKDIAPDKRTVLISHDSLGYFGQAYGLTFVAAQGVSNEGEVSAKTIAGLVNQLKEHAVKAVFLENTSNPRLMEQLAHDGNVTIGGTLYTDSLTDVSGEAPTYISMIKHNVNTVLAALIK